MDARLASVFTAMPAIVQSYDPASQSVDVQPAVRSRYEDETGSTVVEALPVIPLVPVVFPGGGGYRVTFPIQKGDQCLLVFANCSIDRWLRAGGVVDPQDDRRHTINDAFAIFAARDFGHALRNAPTDRMSLGYDTGPTIEISQSSVLLGGNDASDPVARKSDLAALAATFNSHTHVVQNGTPPSPIGTAIVTTDTMSTPSCSSVVKAK